MSSFEGVVPSRKVPEIELPCIFDRENVPAMATMFIERIWYGQEKIRRCKREDFW
ncbi:hypothetical protein KKE45_03935 [Patescibacteria group bacterium]|nr:hypothetical protein [Patescibacteria group bacterium]